MRVKLLRAILRFLFSVLTDLRVEGLENVPTSGPHVLATNHPSLFDVALIFALLGSEDLATWAAEKYERHLLFGTLLRLGNTIFIRRGEVDREALDKAVTWLRAGKVFGIAPEGTRNHTGALLHGKTGVAYLARETDALIVPLAIWGTETIAHELPRLRRARLTFRVGVPFHLPPPDPSERSSALRRDADEVMCRIAVLLPPQYRGVYADHPRLKELLEEAVGREASPHPG